MWISLYTFLEMCLFLTATIQHKTFHNFNSFDKTLKMWKRTNPIALNHLEVHQHPVLFSLVTSFVWTLEPSNEFESACQISSWFLSIDPLTLNKYQTIFLVLTSASFCCQHWWPWPLRRPQKTLILVSEIACWKCVAQIFGHATSFSVGLIN